MVCPNCGEKINKNSSICDNCGEIIKSNKVRLRDDSFDDLEYFEDPFEAEKENEEESEYLEENEDSEEYIEDDEEHYRDSDMLDDLETKLNRKWEDMESDDEYHSEEVVDDEFYIQAYIGEDYKMIKSPINIFALLLSWMYFVYRKLYLIGIIGLVITGYIIKFYFAFLPYYIVIVMVLSGFLFNPIYLIIVRSRVSRLMNKYEDSAKLEDACVEKGGVNTPVALLIFLIFLVIMIISYVNVDYHDEKPKFWKENSENNANCLLMSKQAYEMIDDKLIVGVLDSSICHVVLTNQKTYDIYLKIDNEDESNYYYFKNSGKYLTLEGDTSKIEEWTKLKEDKTILAEEEKMLQLSKTLSNKYQDMIKNAETEDLAINNRSNQSEKQYYYFEKKDIYK